MSASILLSASRFSAVDSSVDDTISCAFTARVRIASFASAIAMGLPLSGHAKQPACRRGLKVGCWGVAGLAGGVGGELRAQRPVLQVEGFRIDRLRRIARISGGGVTGGGVLIKVIRVID